MQFKINNIGGGIDTAIISLQEVRDTGDATPSPMPVSSVQLVVPLAEGQGYKIGETYELSLTKAK
jgi:hypothetical protein